MDSESRFLSHAPDALTFHFAADHQRAIALYEQVHCNVTRASFGGCSRMAIRPSSGCARPQIGQIGFEREELLIDRDGPHVRGFAILRDFFRLSAQVPGLSRQRAEVDAGAHPRRSGAIDRGIRPRQRRTGTQTQTGDILLNCAPAINLFEESSNRVRLDDRRHEYVVTPDSSPITHYEIQRLLPRRPCQLWHRP